MCPLHFMHFIWGLLTIMTAAGFISYNLLADPTSTRGMTCRNVSVVRWRSSDGANQSSKKNGSLFPGIAFSRLVQNHGVFFVHFFSPRFFNKIYVKLLWQSLDFLFGNHWISLAWHKTTHPNAYCKYGLDDEFTAAPPGLAEEFEGETMRDNYIHGSPPCGVFKW